ncbi:MAG: GNAT family N-acetyltransferase [Planctomycetota bacterium]
MLLKRLHSFEDVLPYRAVWNAMSSDHSHSVLQHTAPSLPPAHDQSPCCSWDWCESWWQAYSQGRKLCVMVGSEDGSPETTRFIAPWCIEESTARGRRIKFLGTGHACSDSLRILNDGDHQFTASALANWLMEANTRSGVDEWDFLSFDGLREGEPSTVALRDAMAKLGCNTREDQALDCWRLSMSPTWEEYFEGLGSKNRRRKVRDVKRKYIDSGRSELQIASTPNDYAEFYDEFVALHQLRRQSLGETGCFASQEFSSFLRTVSERFFESGSLVLAKLLLDGQTAAFSLGIEYEGIHYVYQSGMAPEMSKCNPGWIMNVHLILRALQVDLKAIDFMRGNEPYKEKIGASCVKMCKFRIVAPTANAQFLDTVWRTKDGIKRGLPELGNWFYARQAATNKP